MSAEKKPKQRFANCHINGERCSDHGGDVIHGAEAEELRRGIERIIELGPGAEGVEDLDTEIDELREAYDQAMQRLLDRIDARDSLAFGETKQGGLLIKKWRKAGR